MAERAGLRGGMHVLEIGTRLGRLRPLRRGRARLPRDDDHDLAGAAPPGDGADPGGRAGRPRAASSCATTATSTARTTPSSRSRCSRPSAPSTSPTFFEACDRALRPGGRLSLQVDHVSGRLVRAAAARAPTGSRPTSSRAGFCRRSRRSSRPCTGPASSCEGSTTSPRATCRRSQAWRASVPCAARRGARDGLRRAVHPDVGLLPRDQRGGVRDGHHAGPPDRAREGARPRAEGPPGRSRPPVTMGYRRSRDSRPGRAPPRASRRRHRGHRGPRVLVGVRRGSTRVPGRIGRGRPGGVRGLPRQAVPDRAGRPRRRGPARSARRTASSSASPTRMADVDALLPRDDGRDPGLARRRRGDAGRACASRSSTGSTRARTRSPTRSCTRPARRSRWRSRRAARTRRTAGSRRSRTRYAEMTPRPGGRDLGEAAGQAAAAADAQALTVVPRGVVAGDRLQHLPDLERLPGPVRQPRHRQRRSLVKPHPARGAAAGDHRRGRPRGARRGRLLAGPRRARASTRPASGSAQTLALRPEVRLIDYTGSTAFGDLARDARARRPSVFTEKAGVNTVVDRLHRRLPGHAPRTSPSRCRSTAARCARRRRTCSCPRDGIDTDEGAPVVRRGRDGPGGGGRRAARRPTRAAAVLGGIVGAGRARAGRRGEPRGGRGARVAMGSSTPSSPTPSTRTPLLVAPAGVERERLRPRVLRAGGLPRPDRPARTRASRSAARTTREHGAMTAGLYSTDPARRRAGGGHRRRRRRVAVDQPHRRRLRQPVGGLLRLPRDRRQPGGERRRSPTRRSSRRGST